MNGGRWNYDILQITVIMPLLMHFTTEANPDGCLYPGGDTALMYACQYLPPEGIQLLLTSSADVNATNSVGVTPLMVCVQHWNIQAVELLLDHGADIGQIYLLV